MNAELNERVAEELMGWTRPPNTRAENGFFMQTKAAYDEWIADKWWRAPDGTYHEHPPDYSGDWAAIGELLEKLQTDDCVVWAKRSCRYVQNQTGDNEWQATVDRSRGEGTFGVALCEAALKAKDDPCTV